jgi:hypothetical protein
MTDDDHSETQMSTDSIEKVMSDHIDDSEAEILTDELFLFDPSKGE